MSDDIQIYHSRSLDQAWRQTPQAPNFPVQCELPKGRSLTWANFIGRDINEPNRIVTVPMDLERAKIVIPAMTINGQTYESQELSIVRKKYSGIIPVNC